MKRPTQNDIERPIYRLAGWCGILLLAAFVVPRFVPPDEGFAAAATASLVFLAMLLFTTLLALYLLAQTIHVFDVLSAPARVCGIAPALIMLAGLAGTLLFLGY
ncbi:MAG: hypothetical protein WBQ78_02790 [Gammaproteobacteria bacterium]